MPACGNRAAESHHNIPGTAPSAPAGPARHLLDPSPAPRQVLSGRPYSETSDANSYSAVGDVARSARTPCDGGNRAAQCFVDRERIYVMTYWRAGAEGELLELNRHGSIETRLRLPIRLSPAHTPYPATVYNGTWYQLARDGSGGAWRMNMQRLR